MIALSWRDIGACLLLLAALHLAGKVTEGTAAVSSGEIALSPLPQAGGAGGGLATGQGGR